MRPVFRVEVTGLSMLPTLMPKERLLCVGIFRRRSLALGAIVVIADFEAASELMVKRVSKIFSDGSFEVMGDNRGISIDSRQFGVVSPDSLQGRVWFCYSPNFRSLWRAT